jgi:hypothetical protein
MPDHNLRARRLAAVSKSSEARSYLMNPTGELHAVVRNFRFARHSEVKLCQSLVQQTDYTASDEKRVSGDSC